MNISTVNISVLWLIFVSCCLGLVQSQLPEDMERELNQSLAEQARLQALRQRQQMQQHQLEMQRRLGAGRVTKPISSRQQTTPSTSRPVVDPNNYSFQHVSPPIQYSYYQPYGDAAAPNQQNTNGQSANANSDNNIKPMNLDLNNLNFDIPQQQPQSRSDTGGGGLTQQYKPSFTGAGGLPEMLPVAGSSSGAAPPLPTPQAQGPPLSEADFRDITGGENYGAPSGSEFGLDRAAVNRRESEDSAAPVRGGNPDFDDQSVMRGDFGVDVPDSQQGQAAPARARSSGGQGFGGGMPDFMKSVMGGAGLGGGRSRAAAPAAPAADGLADFAGLGGGPGAGSDFDFASQPSGERATGSSRSSPSQNSDQTMGAPNSIQGLLGSSFSGLGSGGLDGFAQRNNNPQSSGQRSDDGTLDLADMGDRSDGFTGADFGNFEQPKPSSNDQDFNYASPANQQPVSVPYPDGNPQFVGSLLALGQPQMLTQARYNAMPDKGTYQNYPAYEMFGSNEISEVRGVVSETQHARRKALGRYGQPSPSQLAPEYRALLRPGVGFDYSQPPVASAYSAFE